MKFSLVPPLLMVCSNLMLQDPVLPTAHALLPTTQSEKTGNVISRTRPFSVIFHPSTSTCVLRTSRDGPLKLGPCNQSDRWYYTPQKFLVVKGTYFCLQAVSSGNPAKLGIICSESDSKWEVLSNPKPHISTKLEDGSSLCMDTDPDNTLVTNPCLCLSSSDGVCQSDSQWFEITNGNTLLASRSSSGSP